MISLNWVYFNYKVLFIYLLFIIVISIFIIMASYLLINQIKDYEKVSPYECGFSPFDDARNKFDVRYYLVSILFIIFDLEVSFIFPVVLVLKKLSYISFLSILIFLFILTIGFVYEWQKGALEWE